MKTLIATLLLLVSLSALGFQPRTGLWWNPAESGRGFNIDIQNGVLVLTVYTYDTAGNAQWYLASGFMTDSQQTFTATLDKYSGGQCITCAYAAPALTGNDGTITISFTSPVTGTMTFPGGRTTAIQPANFNFGVPPAGLFGDWVFTYDVGAASFGDHYTFSQVLPATSNGNGIAVDVSRAAGCELQVTGSLAGAVACVQVNASGAIVNSYYFTYGLDETYDGLWVAPGTNNAYAMKGFRTRTSGGFAKAAAQEPLALQAVKAQVEARFAQESKDRSVASPGILSIFKAIAAGLQRTD